MYVSCLVPVQYVDRKSVDWLVFLRLGGPVLYLDIDFVADEILTVPVPHTILVAGQGQVIP